MKIAIHPVKGSFSDRWITYCREKKIPFKLVNCFDSDIVEQLNDCDVLMWHYHHTKFEDVLVAKKILFAIEHAGKTVYPDFHTNWHFDDKIGQKYLLEAIGAPLVPTYVFYNKKEAIDWVNTTEFPKVFKLKSGAGSLNVRLVKSKNEAIRLVNKAFSKGFSQFNTWGYFKDRYNKFRHGKDSFTVLLKGFGRLFISTEYSRKQCKEKGYVYFQDFIPGNECDYRITVYGNRAAAAKRMNRDGDFRASGSGIMHFEKELFDVRLVKMAFELNDKIKAQSLNLDFIFDANRNPLLVEMSYGFPTRGHDENQGYWDKALNWHEGKADIVNWIMDDLVAAFEK